MKKKDQVLRDILYRVFERGERFIHQIKLAKECGVSADLVGQTVTKLHDINCVDKKPMGFLVVDPEKILLYWAATRNLKSDIVYSTWVPSTVQNIEAQMPPDSVFTCYSGYKLKFGDAPFRYDEVYVYANPNEVKRRFPEMVAKRMNLFVLKPDPNLEMVSEKGSASLAQIYVDLWQIGTTTARRFTTALEGKIRSRMLDVIRDLGRVSPHSRAKPKTVQN